MQDKTSSQRRVKNLALAGVAGLAGCSTIVIITVALIVGLWLDAQLGQRGPCTFGMLIVSIPFSLYAMLRITLGAIQRIVPQINYKRDSSHTEEV